MKNMKSILLVALLILGQSLLFSAARQVTNSQIPEFKDRATISVNTLAGAVTPADLVQSLLGGGVIPSNISYTGADLAAGTFSGGIAAGLGIPSGIILSSGAAELAIGPNDSNEESYVNGLPGDLDLTALIGGVTNDACVLEFDFIPQTTNVQFTFVLGSEEYPEYITQYFDVFGFFLNGVNIALIPGTSTPIAINTINHTINTAYYISNSPMPGLYDIQCDGFTVPISINATVIPNQINHIKLAVADFGDSSLDTWIFMNGESFISGYNVFVDSAPQGARIWVDGAPTALFTPNTISQVTNSTSVYAVEDDGGPYTFYPVTITVPNITGDQSLFFDGVLQQDEFTYFVESHEYDTVLETPFGPDLNAEILFNGASFAVPIFTPYTFGLAGNYPFVAGTYSVYHPAFFDWQPVSVTFDTIEMSWETDFWGISETVPVELSSFTATLTATQDVRLTWVTQSESNMWGYRVYRSESADQANLVLITPNMYQAGNTSTMQTYNHVDNEVEVGYTYYYWLETVEYNSNAFHGPVSVTVDNNTTPVIPETTAMKSAYPNPFRTGSSTSIEVSLKESGTVTIYNILGQVVRTFAVSPGTNTITWNGKDSRGNACRNGIYFYKLSTENFNETRKMVIVK